MSKRSYRLLKPLPDAKVGDVYNKTGHSDRYYNEYTETQIEPVIEHNSYFAWQVENNTEFFEEILPESKDWQVECFTDGKRNFWRNKDGLYTNQPFDKGLPAEYFLNNNCKPFSIWQVTRLKDNEVFSVGDTVCFQVKTNPNWIINEFYIRNDKVLIARDKSTMHVEVLNDDLKKLPQPSIKENKEDVFVWYEGWVKAFAYEKLIITEQYLSNIQKAIDEFKQSKQQPIEPKKEAELVLLDYIEKYSFGSALYNLVLTEKVSDETLLAIKSSISNLLNGTGIWQTHQEVLEEMSKMYTQKEFDEAMKCVEKGTQKKSVEPKKERVEFDVLGRQKIYTQQQMDEAIKDAFEDSRLCHPLAGMKWDTLNDYLNSLKDKQ